MHTMEWLAVAMTVSLGACTGGSTPAADPDAPPEAPADVDAPPANAVAPAAAEAAAAEPAAATTVEAPEAAGGGLLPFDCSAAALAGAHPTALRLYRNAVFARHGRAFTSEDLRAAFGSVPGYTADPDYTDARLSDDERACVTRIVELERGGTVPPIAVLDLDGDGAAESVRWDGASLSVGDASLALRPVAADGDVTPAQWIDLDVGDGARELLLTTDPGIEDEWQFQIVRYAAGQLTPLLPEPAWLSHPEVQVGHRALTHVAIHCGQTVTTTWRLAGDALTPTKTTTGDRDPELCAACPYVYRLGEGAGFAGEILRHLDDPSLERDDTLAIGSVDAGPVRVRLVELELETTWLDALWLEVDGQRLSPVDCGAHCTDDGVYTWLAPHDALEVQFDVPVAGNATLVAEGHYRPHVNHRGHWVAAK